MVSCRSLSVDRISSCRKLLVVALSCATLWSTSETVGAQGGAVEDIKTATDEQIAGWIVELDDNRYATRENAQFRLEKAGSAAIDQVANSALSGSLESSTRALNVLLAWSEGGDPALRIAALEQIVDLPQRPTEAQQASQILAHAREQAALAKIVELGGRHNIAQPMQGARAFRLGRGFGQPLQVTIGPHWKGNLEGLKLINEIPRAKVLSLHSAPLDDKAVPVMLEMHHLTRIELYGTKLSDAAIVKLRDNLSSKVTLDHRGGALLGIVGSLTGPAQVREVRARTAAQKAGLKQGDVITEIDGEKVADFAALTGRIAKHEPGDSVTLKITRVNRQLKKQEQLEIRVTFDQWGKQPLAATQPAVQPIQVVAPAGINIDRR